MPKQPKAQAELPPQVRAQLRTLGANLAIARQRRQQSMRAWAERIGVSEPTLARMERGDPGVAFGLYATALWLIGRASAIGPLADPQADLGALETEVRAAQARAVRRPASVAARLRAAQPSGPDADPDTDRKADPGPAP